jgi:hypothetical protein
VPSFTIDAGAAALVGAVLLCSGVTKMAVPAQAASAVRELAPSSPGRVEVLVRMLAAVEIGAALALSVAAARPAGAAVALLLGIGFAAVGLLGALRGSGVPCGCFGRPDGHPLGVPNVAIGLALALVSAAVLWAGPEHRTDELAGSVLLTAGLALLLTGWLQRDLVSDLLRVGSKPKVEAIS